MLINRRAVRQYVSERQKSLTKDSMTAVDHAVAELLDRACENARGFARITPEAVEFAAHGVTKR